MKEEDFVEHLLVEPEEAIRDLNECIEELTKTPGGDYRQLLAWFDRTSKVLDHVFLKHGSAYFYQNSGFSIEEDWYENTRQLSDVNIPRALGILKRLVKLISEKAAKTESPPSMNAKGKTKPSKRVFVVHGHDEGVREKVERLLDRVGLEPIVLNKKANEGKTIIEKIEAHSDVGFAVVIFTPDDHGGSIKAGTPSEHRPRQNVLIELGYFWGKIGRDKVCLLNSIGPAISSDLAGLGYTAIDDRGAWRMELAKELKKAGYEIDANLLLEL